MAKKKEKHTALFDKLKRAVLKIPEKFKWIISGFLLLFLVILFIPLPRPLFNRDYATVLLDREGYLLGASIAEDQQWRFPPVQEIPSKLENSILQFEDKNFYYHPGIDPGAVLRAIRLNIRNKKITSGASTITMQVIRLSRKRKKRTYGEKIIEAFMALKLELLYSKKEILAFYVSHAPFGGNVVGIQSAAWRYFARGPDNLSWGESALLAVLPNNPAMIHPGKNRLELKAKRNNLLLRLMKRGFLSDEEAALAMAEPLPRAPRPLPALTPHLLNTVKKEGLKGQTVVTSVDYFLQEKASAIIRKHHKAFSGSFVENAAALILDLNTGEALAYVGNLPPGEKEGSYVDLIKAKRSTGSLLKPPLYALALDEGTLLPTQLMPDYPLFFDEFVPQNFHQTYDGAIRADRALARSLNLPFISLLKDYGISRFHRNLEKMGLKLDNPPSHYGLTLIIGGAESTLWDLTAMYAGMGRVLKEYTNSYGKSQYPAKPFFPNTYKRGGNDLRSKETNENALIGASSLWYTFKAMMEVERPNENFKWQIFSSSRPIAWKTGTSFGNKDAWAIGLTPGYVVGVWVGNADSEGRPEIRGSKIAGPILFDLFDLLPGEKWFDLPLGDFKYTMVCPKSGMLAGPYCGVSEKTDVPLRGLRGEPCAYHKIVHLDKEEKHQVDSSNYPIDQMIHKTWFVLPPVMEYYYKKRNSSYRVLPPPMVAGGNPMRFIYPNKDEVKLYIPIELDGTPGEGVFEVAHREKTNLYWHLDGEFLGTTNTFHQMGIHPPKGKHEMVVIDSEGNLISRKFEVISK